MKRVLKNLWSLSGRYASPVFVLLLLLSTVMWYITKLSYSYSTQIPLEVSIEDNDFRVYCTVEGSGYKLFAHRYILNDQIRLNLDAIEITASVNDKDSYIINPLSLQNAISTRKDDIRILSIGDIPEITIIKQE